MKEFLKKKWWVVVLVAIVIFSAMSKGNDASNSSSSKSYSGKKCSWCGAKLSEDYTVIQAPQYSGLGFCNIDHAHFYDARHSQ